jgi:hypothetical protein
MIRRRAPGKSFDTHARARWGCLVCALGCVLAIVLLMPLAHASPPDPSWVGGLYDGDDFDDVVVMLTGCSGIIHPFPLGEVRPILAVAGAVFQAGPWFAPTAALSTSPARGPPAR